MRQLNLRSAYNPKFADRFVPQIIAFGLVSVVLPLDNKTDRLRLGMREIEPEARKLFWIRGLRREPGHLRVDWFWRDQGVP